MLFQRFAFILLFCFIGSRPIYAQTSEKGPEWLKAQLNELVVDADEQIKPVFDLKDCQMTMNAETKEEGVAVRMSLNWPLKEVQKVSYKAAADGKYTLVLDIPAKKVKGKMKVGVFTKALRPKGNDGQSTFELNTTDEKQVESIRQELEAAVKACQ